MSNVDDCDGCSTDPNSKYSFQVGSPVLAALGNYGGYTPTMPPIGAAIGAGKYQAGEPTTDQRGAPRPSGGAIDTGAVQVSGNPPMIAVSPNWGSTSGGTQVTITGTGLDSITAVKFDTVPSGQFTIVSTSYSSSGLAYVVANSPAYSSGTVDVTVSNGTVTSTIDSTDQFTFVAPPTATVNEASVVLTVNQATGMIQPIVGGGAGPLTYSISPTPLPAGLSFNSTTGSITATPTAYSPSAVYTVMVTDTYNQQAKATFSLEIDKATPTVTLTPSATSITAIQTLTIAVTVSAVTGNPIPTGQVTISGGGYTSPLASLSSGSATFNIPARSLSVGSDTLTVNYVPDAPSFGVYSSASGVANVTVTAASNVTPTVTVTPSASSITTAQALTATVTVSGGSGNPTPSGVVVLSGGGYTPPALLLSSGSANFTIPSGSLSVGSNTLTVNYTPDASGSMSYNSTSGSATVTVTSNKTTPTVTITPSASSITAAQALTLVVSVNGGTGYPTPTGSVALSGGGYSSLTAVLSSGNVSVSIPAGSLATGSDVLTASYTPGSSSSSAYNIASGSTTITVNQLAAMPTFSIPPGTYTSAQTVAITDSTPGTTIYFTTNGIMPTTSSTVYSGPIAVSSTETIEAIATASGYSQSAVATAAYTINLPKTTPSVSVSTASSSISTAQSLQVTISVSGASGNSTPTGIVTGSSGGYTSTQASLTNGTASIVIPAGSLSTGNDTLTATYAPDTASSAIYKAASGTASITVTNPVYSMTATSVTIASGGLATSTVTLSSSNGYAGTVFLVCAITSSPSGATDLPTCTTTQTVALTSATTSATATIAVNSTAASAAVTWPNVRNGRGWAVTGGTALALLLIPWIPRKRRNCLSLIGVLVATTLLGGLVACGGVGGGRSTTPPPSNPGTTKGSYTVAVTGTGNDSATTTASTTFTITVN